MKVQDMENISTKVSTLMRTICSSLQTPVTICLLLIMALTLIVLGTLLVELVFERRYLKVWMPRLVDDLKQPVDLLMKLPMLRTKL
jgi:hypothetical protein